MSVHTHHQRAHQSSFSRPCREPETDDGADNKTSRTSLRLVVIADDCGYDSERDNGILECFQKSGIISGGSLLVNGNSAPQFSEKAARLRGLTTHSESVPSSSNPQVHTKSVDSNVGGDEIPKFFLGLHLNLTEGIPCSSSCYSGENGLTVTEGQENGSLIHCFRGKHGFRRALQSGTISENEMIAEIRAQVDRFLHLYGAIPSHIDGHQHIHVIPEVATCMITALTKYSWAHRLWIRVPHMMPEELDHCSKTQPCHVSDFLHNVSYNASVTKALFNEAGFRTPDFFIGCGLMGKCMSTDKVIYLLKNAVDRLKNNRENVLEFMCHPGNVSSEEGGCGIGADEFAMATDREHESLVLKELGRKLDQLKKNIRKDNVEVRAGYFPQR